MSNFMRTSLILSALAALPSPAAETSFGLQGHVGFPTGTFGDAGHLDRKAGLGVGFQVPIDFGGGQVLRPKLDYLAFNRDSGDVNYKVDALVFMADYNYYFAQEREGGYFIAGLGVHSTRRDATKTFGPLRTSTDGSTSGLAYNVGLGYAFNRSVALELKYTGCDLGAMDYKLAGTDPSFMGNAVVASVSFTF